MKQWKSQKQIDSEKDELIKELQKQIKISTDGARNKNKNKMKNKVQEEELKKIKLELIKEAMIEDIKNADFESYLDFDPNNIKIKYGRIFCKQTLEQAAISRYLL